MALMTLKRLPTECDMAQLNYMHLNLFIDAFNNNAIAPFTAKVELMHNGLTVCLGDYAWELIESNDWYYIATEE